MPLLGILEGEIEDRLARADHLEGEGGRRFYETAVEGVARGVDGTVALDGGVLEGEGRERPGLVERVLASLAYGRASHDEQTPCFVDPGGDGDLVGPVPVDDVTHCARQRPSAVGRRCEQLVADSHGPGEVAGGHRFEKAPLLVAPR